MHILYDRLYTNSSLTCRDRQKTLRMAQSTRNVCSCPSMRVYALFITFAKPITNEIIKASTLIDVATIPHTNPAMAMPRPLVCTRLISLNDKDANTIATIPLKKPMIPRTISPPAGKVIKDIIPSINEVMALPLVFACGGT